MARTDGAPPGTPYACLFCGGDTGGHGRYVPGTGAAAHLTETDCAADLGAMARRPSPHAERLQHRAETRQLRGEADPDALDPPEPGSHPIDPPFKVARGRLPGGTR